MKGTQNGLSRLHLKIYACWVEEYMSVKMIIKEEEAKTLRGRKKVYMEEEKKRKGNDILMIKKYLKKCLLPSTIREVQSKTTLIIIYH